MQQGCISLGEVKCDGCHRLIPHAKRYLIIEEKEGVISRLCIDCCLKKGYARYKEEKKGEEVLTFFTD
ncbi:hypothetical protein ACFLYC_02545 [Chloroflexota bacterium]